MAECQKDRLPNEVCPFSSIKFLGNAVIFFPVIKIHLLTLSVLADFPLLLGNENGPGLAAL